MLVTELNTAKSEKEVKAALYNSLASSLQPLSILANCHRWSGPHQGTSISHLASPHTLIHPPNLKVVGEITKPWA